MDRCARGLWVVLLAASAACSSDAKSSFDLAPRADRSPSLETGAHDSASPDLASPIDAFPIDASSGRRPIIFVHGINGSSQDFAVMIGRLVADGWSAAQLFAIDFADPAWGCNVDNAKAIAALVTQARAQTGAAQVDLIAHSMGNLSSRHYLKNGGGTAFVRSYLSLGAMHHGFFPPCLSPLDVCVWKELCQSGPFLTQLNAPPATPGPTRWASIYGTADETVSNQSSQLAGALNIAVVGVTHAGPQGLQQDPVVYEHVKRLLLAK